MLEKKERENTFSIVVVSEGAHAVNEDLVVKNVRDNGAGVDNTKLGRIGEKVCKRFGSINRM